MRLLVTAPAHFAMSPDRTLWINNPSMSYDFWTRYLDVFDEVNLLVRAQPRADAPADWNRATGPGVQARPLPDFIGPWGFAKDYARINRTVRRVLGDSEAILA